MAAKASARGPCRCQIRPNRLHRRPCSTLTPTAGHRTTDPCQPPPTNTGPPQPFHSLSDPHPQPFQAFLYVRFKRFRRFLFPQHSQAFQAFLMTRGPSTHHRAPLTHASHHRPTLVHLSRFRVSPIITHSRFRRYSSRSSSRSSSRFRRFLFPEQ